jgi:tellurite methyltransferase
LAHFLECHEVTLGIFHDLVEIRGGYDDGYKASDCFWGHEPSSLVRRLSEWVGDIAGQRVLDAGCGEGKNAIYLAQRQAAVDAFDLSPFAIARARTHWGEAGKGVFWRVADAREEAFAAESYDIVIAYGLLHCFKSPEEVVCAIRRFQEATRPGGLHLICAFNDRFQDLSAHPGFTPLLQSHAWYLSLYKAWKIIDSSDSDLTEEHPHNNIRHTHSMTRIVSRKPE